jgi:hypothetical protein
MAQPQDRTAAVLYGAKSTADERGSIPAQLAACREAVEREGGREIVAEFSDEAASAYKGSRGPGLADAKRTAERTAADRGACELWVFDPDRLARGDGRKGAAHLAQIYWWAVENDVTLRAVQNDHALRDAIYATVEGVRTHGDSKAKAGHVRRGLRAAFERGQRGGGPIPDGYQALVRRDADDRVIERSYRPDPERAEVVRVAFDLYRQGRGDTAIARELNRLGHRTKRGRPWERSRVQDMLTNPFYAGRIVRDRGKPTEEVRDGGHPPLIDPAVFDRLLAERPERDNAPDAHPAPRDGRPPSNHALARLAVCGRCGGRMTGYTASYRRKDGTRKRTYKCRNYHHNTGVCDQGPVDGALVDAAVTSDLRTLLVDFEAWRGRIEDRHNAERGGLARQVERAEEELAAQAHKTEKVEAKWSEYLATDERKADLVLPMVERERTELAEAEVRARAARDAFASVPTEAPVDAMLDFMSALQRAITGRLDDTDSLAEVNVALRELFSCFRLSVGPRIYTRDGKVRFDGERREILIQPFLRADVLTWARDWALAEHEGWPKLVPTDEEPPPLHHLAADLSETAGYPKRTCE